MKKTVAIASFLLLFAVNALASSPNKYNLMIAPATLTEHTVTLLWDKQFAKDSVSYEILLNGKAYAATGKTNFTISNLLPNTLYSAALRLKNDKRNVKRLMI